MAADDPDVDALLTVTDILIDGPFIQNRRSLSLAFRGSDNQRLLDITAYPDRKAIKIITDDEIREMNLEIFKEVRDVLVDMIGPRQFEQLFRDYSKGHTTTWSRRKMVSIKTKFEQEGLTRNAFNKKYGK